MEMKKNVGCLHDIQSSDKNQHIRRWWSYNMMSAGLRRVPVCSLLRLSLDECVEVGQVKVGREHVFKKDKRIGAQT